MEGADLLMNLKKKHFSDDDSVSNASSQSSRTSRSSRASRKSNIIVDIGDVESVVSSRKSSVKYHRRSRAASVASDVSITDSDDASTVVSTSSSKKFNTKKMTQEEILKYKRELLYQFDRLENKGVRIPRKFNMSSDIDEMKHELDRLKNDRDIDISVKFQRRMMMAIITGTEFVNSRFNPFDFKLDGWSENVNDSIDDYNDIFEQLHEKYKGKSKMPPELKLLFMLGGSAFMFHLSNTLLKSSMPGMEQVMKQNPDLMKQFASATVNSMAQNNPSQMSSGFGGILSGLFGGGGGGLGSIFGMGGGGGSGNLKPSQQMKGPSNVDDILHEIDESRKRNQNHNDNDRMEAMSTISGSDMTELPDDASVSGIFPKRGGKRTLNI
jgi:hypothetical protein